MASSSVDSDAEGSGDALAAFGLAGAGLLPETPHTDGIVMATSDGLYATQDNHRDETSSSEKTTGNIKVGELTLTRPTLYNQDFRFWLSQLALLSQLGNVYRADHA